jgi:2'-5' RNA ligase
VGGLKNKTAKYFIALVLEDESLKAVEALKTELFERYGLKGALRSPAHITLHRPFEWRLDREDQLIKSLEGFTFGEALQLKVRNFASFEPRVIYAHVEPNQKLDQLHAILAKYCRQTLHLFNETDDRRGFHPHITIAFRDLKKPLFYQLETEFRSRTLEMDLRFLEFSLLKLDKQWEVLKKFNKS